MNRQTIQIDYYSVLNVSVSAKPDEIAAAYRKQVKLYHPDINRSPDAEARMKDINQAFYVLRDAQRRTVYNGTRTKAPSAAPAPSEAPAQPHEGSLAKAAVAAANRYFTHLQMGDYNQAYEMLSSFDHQYVTQASFANWRRWVQKLFTVREVVVRVTAYQPHFAMEEGVAVSAYKLNITVLEKNHTTGETERCQMVKYAVLEQGVWRIYLGYRDINEIARAFEDLSKRQESGEMTRHWESYCQNTCRQLDMLSYAGLLKEAKRELYRCRRYGQTMTICCMSLNPGATYHTEESMGDLLETAAKVLAGALRETDIVAYIGQGRFVVLFVELKRKHAQAVIERLLETVRKAVEQELHLTLGTDYAYVPYDGEALKTSIDNLINAMSR